MTTARVILWGSAIGAVTWDEDRAIGVFQYEPDFARAGVEPAPVVMPVRAAPYDFPELPVNTFKGLPGLLADSLPDKFGNALIDAWLAEQGRRPGSFNPVERLCHTGSRGMGALEFEPALKAVERRSQRVDVKALVALSNRVLDDRISLQGKFSGADDRKAVEDILRVGTSAGGARAKAILAWNEATGEFRSDQAPHQDGFTPWLMKFDGVRANKDKELADPQGFGRIEYAYHLMAVAAGVEMAPCRLHEEGGRAHFMTQRFDRKADGGKLHMQSLGALMHYDFNRASAYSYEQAIQAIRLLRLPMSDVEQQVRRAFFNVIARNQDDHVKNIAFLMDKSGAWRLSPAFDIAYAYNPDGDWTSRHQMSLAGKWDDFEREDLIAFAVSSGVKKGKANRIIEEIVKAVAEWPEFAARGGVFDDRQVQIAKSQRLDLARTFA